MGKAIYDDRALENLSRKTKRNVIKAIDNATPEDYVKGLTWYQARHELLEDLASEYRYPVDQVAAVMAVTSPQLSYAKNRQTTVEILEGKSPQNGIHSGIAKAYDVLASGDTDTYVRGPKVRSFFRNLANPMCPESVTIDIWMSRVAGFTEPKELARKGAYQAIAKGIKRAAKAKGILPNQAQAIAWIAMRGSDV